MQATEKMLLKDHSDSEKGAYLGAIASIATADHSATGEEIEYLTALADAADISEEQKRAVLRAATELSDVELKRCLDILKGSELRFSLVADLISFSEADKDYSENEQKSVENIARYLGVNQEQFSLLDQFVKNTSGQEVKPEEVENPAFLASSGLKNKFQTAGIDWKKFLTGLLGVAGPMMLARMFTRNRGTGMAGGLGGLLNRQGGGGIGSLISSLSGGRGLGNLGGLLTGILGRR